jgi:hypothetical protein
MTIRLHITSSYDTYSGEYDSNNDLRYTYRGRICKRARFYYPCAYIPTYIAQWYLAGALFIISSKQIIPIDGHLNKRKTIYIACMCMYMYIPDPVYFHISTPSSLSPSNLSGSRNSYSYIPTGIYSSPSRYTYMHTLTV